MALKIPVSQSSMLCYKLQSLGRKCPNSALKLKFPLSSVFDKLIAGLLISLCSFGVLPDDCSVDGFFAKRRPCLIAASLHLLVSTNLKYAHSVPLVMLLNVNLFFCLFVRQSVERSCKGSEIVKCFALYNSLLALTPMQLDLLIVVGGRI